MNKLLDYINKFSSKHILVIGDIILDKYIWGDVLRISPEAPVPVVDVANKTKRLGGASNVLNNITSLGGKCTLCGVVGDDGGGRYLINTINDLGMDIGGIIVDNTRSTTIKTRVIAKNQQIVRCDVGTKEIIDREVAQKLIKSIKTSIDDVDAIIISDYNNGVISPYILEAIENINRSKVIVGIDPKPANFKFYRSADIITPNHHEAATFCGFQVNDNDSLIRAGKFILNELKCKSVLITQGKDGMTLFESNIIPHYIPTAAKKVFDVSGAGDTVISTLMLGLASGMNKELAALVSNIAAGLVVEEIGTSTITLEQLKKAVMISYK